LAALALVPAGYGSSASAGPAVAAGYDFPVLSGRVVDAANLLPAQQRTAITIKLAALEHDTGHQFVVVTVPGLGGHSIEDYGLTLGRTWGIGRKGINDGVLLIVAPVERKVRIEVGYGLERRLSDEKARTIIDSAILPAFRAGDFPRGIAAGVDGVIREISPSERLAA
jgi:uncharacterized protein